MSHPNLPHTARACGGCTLCCRVMGVEELAKPPGVPCSNCTATGCAIYERRPDACRSFHCYYLQNIELDDRWKPSIAGFCMVLEPGRLVAYADPENAAAWRREPYLGQLQAWAAVNLPRGYQVVVAIGERRVAILPDATIDLGVVPTGATITIERRASGWTASVS